MFGNGFVVEVQATNGRALCVHEPDGFWMYGINPGGLAATGIDPDAAHVAFRKTFSSVLFDIASEADSFETFRTAVNEFFEETNAGYEADWRDAVEAVRSKRVQVIGLPEVPAGSPRTISVEMKPIEGVRAADNRSEFESQIAA